MGLSNSEMPVHHPRLTVSTLAERLAPCLPLLPEKSAKSMCWRRVLTLLDNRPLVAEAKERSRVKARKQRMQQPFCSYSNPSDVHHNTHIISVFGVFDSGNQPREQLGSRSSSLSSLASMSNIVWSSMPLPPT